MSQSGLGFSFRRGKKSGLNNTAIKNGSLNFTVDTKELYVDIDDTRLEISSVEFYNTEEEITSITTPGNKLYVAKDTNRIMTYSNGSWIYVSSSSGGAFYGTCSTGAGTATKAVTVYPQ